MIKANELKIGNFIVDDDGALSKVIGFKPYDHSVRCDGEEGCDILIDIYGADGKVRRGYAVESTIASPIPVNPQWLERFEFTEYDDGAWIGPQTRDIDKPECVAIKKQNAEFLFFGHDWKQGKPFQYAHQLQNLYFAMTDKELPFTPPSL